MWISYLDQYYIRLLYADDLFLPMPSGVGLHEMLNICQETATASSVCYIASKCHCITFDKNVAFKIGPMSIGSYTVDRCNRVIVFNYCLW